MPSFGCIMAWSGLVWSDLVGYDLNGMNPARYDMCDMVWMLTRYDPI